MKTYADFFEWTDKARKELGVVEHLIEMLNSDLHFGWHSPRTQKPDPPDCVCLDVNAKVIGIEVAEVVCFEAAARTARGESVVRRWQRGELAAHIRELLQRKDTRTYLGGPYSEVVACLFTDELDLDIEEVRVELQGERFGPLAQLTSAYLVFSYDAHTQRYPVVPLEVGP